MREIELTGKKYPNMVAIVDDDDYEWLNQWRWFCAGDLRTKYAVRTTGSDEIDLETGAIKPKWSKVRMHIAIMEPPFGMEVDHKDGDGLNNQRFNLRVCTHAENMRNRKQMRNSTSGFMGVQKHGTRWHATIGLNNELLYLGTFDDAKEAAQVRDEAAKKYYGEFANLNFPAEPQPEVKIIPPDPNFKLHRLSERARLLYNSGMYYSWQHMKDRCTNQRSKDWPNYGGRGISFCERWLSFDSFVADLADSWEPGLTLERIDYNGNYTPENCRWISRAEQNNNRRSVRLIEYRGKIQSVSAWGRELGIGKALIYRQVSRGMSFPEAFDYVISRKGVCDD